MSDNSIAKPKCFVIMGYGEKQDYAHQGRMVNLDKTYENIIKPAVKRSGYECIRCDEIKISGLIDIPMFENLYTADLVIADLTTLNSNTFYELGIRHAIRASSTIIIAQEGEVIPFDTNHIKIIRYKHMGEDIGCTESKKKIQELKELIKSIKENPQKDSPFFTYMNINNISELEKLKNNQVQTYTNIYNDDISLLALIGSWDDANEKDRDIIKSALDLDNSNFKIFISYSKINNSPLKLINNKWILRRNDEIKKSFIKLITYNTLTKYESAAITILTDIDTTYELDKNNRFMGSVYGKGTTYSKYIRKGICESLVWLSQNKNDILANGNDKIKYLVNNIIYVTLDNSDWHLWASLNELLPILAEASPKAFLSCLKNHINSNSEMIIELFNQEGDGIVSGNLITGILWGLEKIAWIPEYFQQVCIYLLELSKLDKGGTFSNRPINSLITLLLPWINTTTASTELKINTVRKIFDDYHDIAWNIIFPLLPSNNSITSGVSKPEYITELLNEYSREVPRKEYLEQIVVYSSLIVKLMKEYDDKIFPLLDNLNSIDPESYEDIFTYLMNKDFSCLEIQKINLLWEKLNLLIKKHKQFAKSAWAYSPDIMKKLEAFAEKIKPTNKRILYKYLFTQSKYDLSDEVYDKNVETNWKKIEKDTETKREKALLEIIDEYGLEALPDFIVDKDMIPSIATTLNKLNDKKIDNYLIPTFLESENNFMQSLCCNYIRLSTDDRTDEFFENINLQNLKRKYQLKILLNSKFELSIWTLAKNLLKEDEIKYWKEVNQYVYASKSDLTIAINKLNLVHRFLLSIKCIYISIFNKKPIPTDLIIETFEKIMTNNTEDISSCDTYEFIEIFKYLETQEKVDSFKLARIEQFMYPIFDFNYVDIPQTLYKAISTTPSLYMDLIKLAYKDDSGNDSVTSNIPDIFLTSAWKLLNNFKLIPGKNKEGYINKTTLEQWIQEVLDLANNCNRTNITKKLLGHLLFYTPEDKDGFWIDKTVASILDKFENENMLVGYHSESINSRGCYTVDTTGKAEKDIGDDWASKAEELRKNNFPMFADEADRIAKSYYDMSENSKKLGNHNL